MKIHSNFDVNGDFVDLKISRKRHLDVNPQNDLIKSDPISKSFSDLFNKVVSEVNDLELRSNDLTNQMVMDPESVDIHDVQIAAEQAEMAVLFTKGIVDRVIRAYKEITNLR